MLVIFLIFRFCTIYLFSTYQKWKLFNSVYLEWLQSQKITTKKLSAALRIRTLNRNEYGHHSLYNPDQNDSISRPSYSQIPPVQTAAFCELSQSHNTIARDIEEKAVSAAPRQAPVEQTKVDGLLSPQSGYSNI